ncbi:MAG: helix-turn-helix domain-containing protein [Acidimicrobiia bacterium]
MVRESHNSTAPTRDARTGGSPARERALRAQGRKTMQRLSDAGLRVFARRGFHEARVDDIVRSARTSHGTFYLYFANKEDLLRQLAAECAAALETLASTMPEIDAGPAGEAALGSFLRTFFDTYAHYGVVIRAWMENQVSDRKVDQLGVDAFTHIAQAFAVQLQAAGAPHDDAAVATLMAMLERTSYAMASRDLGFDREIALETLTTVIHRGFFTTRCP